MSIFFVLHTELLNAYCRKKITKGDIFIKKILREYAKSKLQQDYGSQLRLIRKLTDHIFPVVEMDILH